MSPQDCVLLIGAVAGGVATCLAAVGGLWLQVSRHQSETSKQLEQLTRTVNGRNQ